MRPIPLRLESVQGPRSPVSEQLSSPRIQTAKSQDWLKSLPPEELSSLEKMYNNQSALANRLPWRKINYEPPVASGIKLWQKVSHRMWDAPASTGSYPVLIFHKLAVL